jgi:hypothetical protein
VIDLLYQFGIAIRKGRANHNEILGMFEFNLKLKSIISITLILAEVRFIILKALAVHIPSTSIKFTLLQREDVRLHALLEERIPLFLNRL